MLILCQIASHLMIEIKNDVSCPLIFRIWASIFTKFATGMCVYIACIYFAGCAGTFHQAICVHIHRCTRARGSAPSVRARADAWVRATRERCAGRLFRYCCYCWGNNRPSIGRLGTMYLFRCGQRCSIDQGPPFASVEKAPRRPMKDRRQFRDVHRGILRSKSHS